MAIKDAPVVKVLKFNERQAYNPDRPISSLIRTQLLHLHHAENLVVPAQFRTNININHLLTERQASRYIHQVTRLLHEHGGSSEGKTTKKKKASPAKKVDRRPAKKATKRQSKSR